MRRRNIPFSPVRTGRYDPRPLLRVLSDLTMFLAGLAASVVLIHGGLTQPEALIQDTENLPDLPETVRPTDEEPELPDKQLRFVVFTRGKDKQAFQQFLHRHITEHGGEYRRHTSHAGGMRNYGVPSGYLEIIAPLKRADSIDLIRNPNEPAYWEWYQEQVSRNGTAEPGRPDTVISVQVRQPIFEKWQTVALALPLILASAGGFASSVYINYEIDRRRREEDISVRDAQDEYRTEHEADYDYDSDYY